MFRGVVFTVVIIACFAVARAQSDICVESQDRYGRPCNGNGACVNETLADGNVTLICLCDNDYGNTTCNYKKHSQLLVFLLDFFFGPLGVGRFIIGEVWQPVLKLLLSTCGCCIVGAAFMLAKPLGGAASCLVGAGIFVWWLVDVCYFGMNKLKDSHGFYLAPW